MTHAEGLWWKEGRIVVPDSKETKLLILQAMHDHPLAGHFSVTKTLKAINHRFYWRRAAQETILDHLLVKRGRKNKVEYLIKFLGYDVVHNMWQQDMTNCEQLVQDYWAGKPDSESLSAFL
ncbi:MAG: hypothetical protein FRX49_09402 [Trebouxia sp. A1-2]|nr:MAG: hypothetical protein FRX49_09402 [Trebouxia sp. A1-2]